MTGFFGRGVNHDIPTFDTVPLQDEPHETEARAGEHSAAAAMTTYEADPNRFRRVDPPVLYFGSLVSVISTLNPDGWSTNLAPITCFFEIDGLLFLGIGQTGATMRNLRLHGEAVINVLQESLWEGADKMALATAMDPVPAGKPAGCVYRPDKWELTGWHSMASEFVRPCAVTEADAHIEAQLMHIHDEPNGIGLVVMEPLATHVDDRLTVPGTHYVDPSRWKPLMYSFRHYFGFGERQGVSVRAEVK